MRTVLSTTSFIVLAAAGMSAIPTIAAAQVVPSAATPPTDNGLEDIIVTAQKREESAQSVPASISALSGATIAKNKILSIADLANSVTGVSFTANSPQSNEINIRGVVNTRLSSPTSDQSVSTFVDDVYVSRAGNLNSAFYDVERIEILRGPQGVLLGKNVAGGAINVISAPPSFTPSGRVTVTYGNYDHKQTSGYITGGLTDAVAGRLSFQTINHSGFARDISHNVDLENLDSVQFRGQLRFAPKSSDFTANLILDYAKDSSNGPNRVGIPDPNASTAFPNTRAWSTARAQIAALRGGLSVRESFPVWPTYAGDTLATPQEIKHESFNAILRMDKDVADDVRLTSTTGYRWGKANTQYDQTGIGPTNPYNIITTLLFAEPVNFKENISQFSQELRLASTNTASRFDWIIGAYYLHYKVRQFNRFWGESPYEPGGRAPGILGALSGESHWDDHGVNEDKAVFGQIGFAITPTLKIEAGARYTHDSKNGRQTGLAVRTNDRFSATDTTYLTPLTVASFDANYGDSWSQTTPQATLTFTPKPGVLAYATFSRGFKGGGFLGNAANGIAASTPYDPETVTNIEAGLKADFLDHKVRLNIAGFHMKYKDLQVQQTVASCLCNIINNASSATIKGIEAELQVAPVKALRLWTNGTYLDARYNVFVDTNGVDNTGHFLQRTPHWQAAVGVDATASIGSWRDALNARLSYRYQAKMFWAPDNLQFERGFGLLDGRVSLKIPDRDWTVSVYGRNLANKLYRTNIVAFFGDEISSFGAPRTYGAELSIGF